MKWLHLAWRNVLRNKRRTLLSAMIICAGVVALLSAIGFVLASFHGLRESTISSQVGHIQIALEGHFDAFEETPLARGLPPADIAEVEAALQAAPRMRFFMRRLMFEGLLSSGERTVTFVGTGVEPAKESRLSGVFAPLVAGEGLPLDVGSDNFNVLLAVELARTLRVQPGQMVTLLVTTERGMLNAIDFRVAGIYKTGVPDLDRRALIVPVASAQALLDTEKVSRVVAVLDRTESTDAAAAALTRDLPDMEVRRWVDLAPFYQQVVTLYRNIFVVMGAIIVLVVLLSSSNSMLMSIMERVREIGTMRAFGIPERRIRTNFMIEGGLIGLIGSAIGLFLAAITALVVTLAGIRMPPPPGRSADYPLIIFVDPLAYVLVLVGMVVVGAVAAWLPTRVSRRLSIVEELNHS